jgi:hypothetical protein
MENFFFCLTPPPLSNGRGERYCEAVGLFAKPSALLWYSHYVTREISLLRVGEGTLQKGEVGNNAI